MSPDGEMITRVVEKKDFARLLLLEDCVDDWGLARDLGEYLTRMQPDLLVGHLILARACRHLGDGVRAMAEVTRCREVIAGGNVAPIEVDLLVPLVELEARHSRGMGRSCPGG